MALSLQRYTWSDFNSGLHPLLKQRIKKGLERSKLVSIAIKNVDRLPENLLIEILSWLPVKDVLRYKSVCKSWYAIISSPHFISKHLKNNLVFDENCLLAQYYVSYAELQLFELLVDEDHRVLGHEVFYNMPMYSSYVKIVRYPLSVLVYSLRTNSWKYCGDLARNYNLENNKCYVYVKGCCFWMESHCYWMESYTQDDEVIISFDMATDSFKEIHVPDYQQPASKCLGMYDDSLAFFSVHDDEKNLDIWTLNQGIWTKKFSIGPFPEVENPVGHWNCNKVMLEYGDRKLALCDPNTHEIKELGFECENKSCEGIFAYMESLVSIKDKTVTNEGEEVEADTAQVLAPEAMCWMQRADTE